MTDWEKVQGSQNEKPAEFDSTSSLTTVYQRRNINQVEVTSTDGTTATVWEYEERTMSHAEYAAVAIEVTNSKIEYLSMMVDVDIDE